VPRLEGANDGRRAALGRIDDHNIRVADKLPVGVRSGVLDPDFEAAPGIAMSTPQPELQIVDQRVGRHAPRPLHDAGAEADDHMVALAQHLDRFVRREVEQP
jgi:hypothetical protein